jgi:hypothetical protein
MERPDVGRADSTLTFCPDDGRAAIGGALRQHDRHLRCTKPVVKAMLTKPGGTASALARI